MLDINWIQATPPHFAAPRALAQLPIQQFGVQQVTILQIISCLDGRKKFEQKIDFTHRIL
jgi:hypothetical protein